MINEPEVDDVAYSQIQECAIAPNILYRGQIMYFRGMKLRLFSCTDIRKVKFEQNNPQAYRKIMSELSLDPAQPQADLLYVNIDFYASTLTDGKVLIHRVERAELTENSIYD